MDSIKKMKIKNVIRFCCMFMIIGTHKKFKEFKELIIYNDDKEIGCIPLIYNYLTVIFESYKQVHCKIFQLPKIRRFLLNLL